MPKIKGEELQLGRVDATSARNPLDGISLFSANGGQTGLYMRKAGQDQVSQLMTAEDTSAAIREEATEAVRVTNGLTMDPEAGIGLSETIFDYLTEAMHPAPAFTHFTLVDGNNNSIENSFIGTKEPGQIVSYTAFRVAHSETDIEGIQSLTFNLAEIIDGSETVVSTLQANPSEEISYVNFLGGLNYQTKNRAYKVIAFGEITYRDRHGVQQKVRSDLKTFEVVPVIFHGKSADTLDSLNSLTKTQGEDSFNFEEGSNYAWICLNSESDDFSKTYFVNRSGIEVPFIEDSVTLNYVTQWNITIVYNCYRSVGKINSAISITKKEV